MYVWMPAVHIQHKESMLCQTEGVSICTHTFGCPHVWIPHMFGSPICLDASVCLDTPNIFGCPSYLWMLPYIWQHPNIQGGSQTYGGHPNIQGGVQTCVGHQPYREVYKHRGNPNIQGASKHMGECKHGGVQTYRLTSKHMGVSKHMGASKHTGGHPNIWGHSDMWGIQTYRGYIQTYRWSSKCMGGIWTPLSLTKHAFFVLLYVQGASEHHPSIWGHLDTPYGSLYKAYRGHPNIGLCPNIQGSHMGASKHTGDIQTYGWHPNIQTYRGHPNIGGVQTYREPYGGIQTYRGHPNIWGHPNIQGASKHMGGITTYRGIQTYGDTFFLYTPELFLLSCFFFFLILNILSIFQNIPEFCTVCL